MREEGEEGERGREGGGPREVGNMRKGGGGGGKWVDRARGEMESGRQKQTVC